MHPILTFLSGSNKLGLMPLNLKLYQKADQTPRSVAKANVS